MLTFFRYIVASLVLFALSCGASRSAFSQWLEMDTSYQNWNLPDGRPAFTDFAQMGSLYFASAAPDAGLGDIFRSANGGATWSDVTQNLADYFSLLRFGSELITGLNGEQVGISTDSGQSWTFRKLEININGASDVQALLAVSDTLFASTTRSGIFRSIDSGLSWVPCDTGLTDLEIYSLASLGDTLFAGARKGEIYRSTDCGYHWLLAVGGLPPASIFGDIATSLAVLDGTVFAGFDNQNATANDPRGIYRSSNSGQSWTAADIDLMGTCVFRMAVSCSNLFAVTDSGLFRSTDLGGHWTSITYHLPVNTFPSPMALSFIPGLAQLGNDLFFGASSNGIWRLNPLWISEQLPSGSSGDTLRASACGASFSFTSQYVGTCTFATLDSVFITGLRAGEYQLSHTAHIDEPDTSWITVTPASAGTKSLVMTARYVDDESNIIDTSFALTLESAPARSASISVRPAQLSAASQSLVSIPIYASSADSIIGANLKFRINLRTDLLTPESITTPIMGATASIAQVDSAGAWITLTLPANFSIFSDTLIATVNCRVFVTDTEETPISVESSGGEAPNCLSINGAGGQTFTLVSQCGDPALTKSLAKEVTTISSIVPNPAGSVIEIGVRNAGTGGAIKLYDALGCKVMDLANLSNRGTVGSTSDFDVDVSSLPAGVYMVRYSLGSYSYEKPVVILH